MMTPSSSAAAADDASASESGADDADASPLPLPLSSAAIAHRGVHPAASGGGGSLSSSVTSSPRGGERRGTLPASPLYENRLHVQLDRLNLAESAPFESGQAPSAASSAPDPTHDLQEILSSVASGGIPPVLTKEVLDKLLAAAAAAAAASNLQPNHGVSSPPDSVRSIHSSLPDLSDSQRHQQSAAAAASGSASLLSPADSSGAGGAYGSNVPRKSNLTVGRGKSGRSEEAKQQLSVRFDPKQVIYF